MSNYEKLKFDIQVKEKLQEDQIKKGQEILEELRSEGYDVSDLDKLKSTLEEELKKVESKIAELKSNLGV